MRKSGTDRCGPGRGSSDFIDSTGDYVKSRVKRAPAHSTVLIILIALAAAFGIADYLRSIYLVTW